MNVPWFMLSPSPLSLIQYTVLTCILWKCISKNVEYRRFPRVMSLIDSFFVVAFFVCITDAFWCLFAAIKWLPLYPADLIQIVTSMMRDVVAALLFFLFIGGYFKSKILKWRTPVMWVSFSFITQAVWFWLAPSPLFTDYIFAWRHGASSYIIVGGWILSHWIMRIPLWIGIIKTRSLNDD